MKKKILELDYKIQGLKAEISNDKEARKPLEDDEQRISIFSELEYLTKEYEQRILEIRTEIANQRDYMLEKLTDLKENITTYDEDDIAEIEEEIDSIETYIALAEEDIQGTSIVLSHLYQASRDIKISIG